MAVELRASQALKLMHDVNLALVRDSEQDLSAKVNGNEFFTLVGAGSDDGLSLCGDFPMYDHEGDAARSGTQNEICLQGQDVISADEVQGVASGPFESRFGADCELEPSDFVLRRP